MVTLLVIGLVVAFWLDETTGITPGGYIVPGYLALSITDPLRLAATLLIVLCVVGVLKLADRVMLLYGRRRLAFALITGCLLKGLLAALAPALGFATAGLLIIGYVIPGLVAHNCERQGTLKTLTAAAAATALTSLVALAVVG
ncbi:MAG: poly-gamma-glutamate biosynthesis protein PgsC [bacterium]|nr:poly-gamma-glutamate biosynthesis protein PgsC [bacterium]